jgi:hypothetical protein
LDEALDLSSDRILNELMNGRHPVTINFTPLHPTILHFGFIPFKFPTVPFQLTSVYVITFLPKHTVLFFIFHHPTNRASSTCYRQTDRQTDRQKDRQQNCTQYMQHCAVFTLSEACREQNSVCLGFYNLAEQSCRVSFCVEIASIHAI